MEAIFFGFLILGLMFLAGQWMDKKTKEIDAKNSLSQSNAPPASETFSSPNTSAAYQFLVLDNNGKSVGVLNPKEFGVHSLKWSYDMAELFYQSVLNGNLLDQSAKSMILKNPDFLRIQAMAAFVATYLYFATFHATHVVNGSTLKKNATWALVDRGIYTGAADFFMQQKDKNPMWTASQLINQYKLYSKSLENWFQKYSDSESGVINVDVPFPGFTRKISDHYGFSRDIDFASELLLDTTAGPWPISIIEGGLRSHQSDSITCGDFWSWGCYYGIMTVLLFRFSLILDVCEFINGYLIARLNSK